MPEPRTTYPLSVLPDKGFPLTMNPKAIDPRQRGSKPNAARARRNRASSVARSKRETPEAYAARIMRDLEAMAELAED